MIGPPVQDLGFSLEFEEKVFGVEHANDYDVTIPGLVEWGKDLAELGLDDAAAAHAAVLDGLDAAWDRFLSSPASDFVEALGDFLRENDVAGQLIETAIESLYTNQYDPIIAGLEVNAKMFEILNTEGLPFLADWVTREDQVRTNTIQEHLERDGEGGGSAFIDDVADDVEDAIDEFFDELGSDDVVPGDIEAFDAGVADIATSLGALEAELASWEGEGPGWEDVPQLRDQVRRLRADIEAVRAGLADPIRRMGEWSNRDSW